MGRRRRAWLRHGTGVRYYPHSRRPRPGYHAEWYDYLAGRRVHRSRSFDSQRAAREWVRQYNARYDLGQLGQPLPIRLSEAAGEFAHAIVALSRVSQSQYRTSLTKLQALHGDRLVSDYCAAHFEVFIAAELRRGCAAATVVKGLRHFRRFWRWCMDRGYAIRNPVNQATWPRGRIVRERPAISDTDIARLIAALDTEDRKLAVWLGLTTGLDRSVIQRLCPAQIDTNDHTVRVIRGKTGRLCIVPIHPHIWSSIAERLQSADPAAPILSGLTRQHAHRDWWHLACKRAELCGIWFRDLRALAATRLCRLAGASLADASHLLGHADVSTTARHYWVPSPQVRAMFSALPLPGFPLPPAPTIDTVAADRVRECLGRAADQPGANA